MGYSYLSLTEILTSGTKVPNYCTRYILWDAVTANWDSHVWHQSPQLLYTLYSVGCSYLSLTEILTSGTKVPNYCTRYILWDAVTYLYLRYSRLAPRSPIIVHVIFCGMQLLISEILTSGTKVPNYCTRYILWDAVTYLWDSHVWHQSPQLLYTLYSVGCSYLSLPEILTSGTKVTGEFPAQKPLKASNAENVSIWWRHHRRQTVFATRNLTKQLTKCVIKVQPTTWTRHIVTENMTAMGKVDIFMWHSIWWWMIIPYTISSCVPPNLLHKTPL